MRERRYFQYLFFILLTVFSCKDDHLGKPGAGTRVRQEQKKEDDRPNIIFLLTDDQRFDALSFAGNTVLQTPNMDRLAKGGVYFENAYVTTSICAMSRASILTGQYARRHDIWDFGESLTEQQYENTYPALFKKADYITGFIGKFGVGNIRQPTIRKYFDYWEGFNGQGSYKATDNGRPIHLTSKMGDQALTFLEQQKDADKPFLLSMSFKAPHVQGDPGFFLPDAAYDDLYETATIPEPVAAAKEYFNYFPEDIIKNKNGALSVARSRWHDRFSTAEEYQENVKKYYRLVHGVDVVIGRIIEKLNALDMDENTIIVFTSDNGFYLGEYGFAGKWYGSDPSIRVPMIIFDPRPEAPQGITIDKMALNIDIAPTLLSMAGIQKPVIMQGRDLGELIAGNNAGWRTEFFYEHLWPSSDAYYIPSTEGIVTEDYKYMRYFLNRDFNEIMFEEFYDRNKYKDEVINSVNNPDYDAHIDQLKQKLTLMRDAIK
ncbi:sulfatase [Fulvivirga sp. M361]|uniref:sulfatase family protein n=1 Tax=Fulvivirga sp. M361 TaxID=2594266 RepID=UPI00117B0B71|nr:sulfatase [Fulvivirga sp. M361]TRX60016.1 sulfatase [Fulvivirga sp. M361]